MQRRIIGTLEALFEEQLPDRWFLTREHVKVTQPGLFRDHWAPCPPCWADEQRSRMSAAWAASFKRASRRLCDMGALEMTTLTGIVIAPVKCEVRTRSHLVVRLPVDPEAQHAADELRAEAWQTALWCAQQSREPGQAPTKLESSLRWLEWYRRLTGRDIHREAMAHIGLESAARAGSGGDNR